MADQSAKPRLFQIMDHFHKTFPVIEGLKAVQADMRFNTRIYPVEGAVGKGRDLQRAGHLMPEAVVAGRTTLDPPPER